MMMMIQIVALTLNFPMTYSVVLSCPYLGLTLSFLHE